MSDTTKPTGDADSPAQAASDGTGTARLDFSDEKWAQSPSAPSSAKRPVRVSTVIWGVILLALAALFVTTRVLEPDLVDGWTALAWGGLGLGAILIAGGIAAAVRRRE